MRIFLLILIFIVFAGCSPGYEKYEKMSLFDYLRKEKNHSIVIGALITSNHVHSKIDFEYYIGILDKMADKVRFYVGDSKDPYTRINAMNKVIFDDYGYKYDHRKIKSNYYLPTVIMRLKGNCFGLPLLYVCLAEKLDYPIYPVHAPWHIFCRYDDGENIINIEVTSGGKQVTDLEYIDSFLISKKAYQYSRYLKTEFNKRNFIAYISSNIAIHYMYKQPDVSFQFLMCAFDLNPNDIGINIFAGYFFKTVGDYEKNEKSRNYAYEKSKEHYQNAKNIGANFLDPILFNKAYESHKKSKAKITNKEDFVKYYNNLKEKFDDYFY